ncbi:hypothetical protein ACIBG8_42575 [Nonomuraea sp. NPDC050556]|uniref:hypothetical protein n=1 Tax=Nonomuraea sp. NPDC050556 TaxID=3364369 RepID=UPI0037A1CD56
MLQDPKLVRLYTEAVNEVLAGEEIRTAIADTAVSLAGIRVALANDANRILEQAGTEYTVYRNAMADAGEAPVTFPELTRPLLLIAGGFGLAGLVMLPIGLVAPWVSWAGATLLIAAALVALLAYVKDTRFVRHLVGAGVATISADIARAQLVEAVAETELLSEVRARINAARTDRFGHEVSVDTSPGLSEVHERSYHVSTAVAHQVDGLLDRLAGASIGIAGPRGSGKSTLVRRYCENLPGERGDLRCMVSAPVDYVAKEFVLHLFAVFCRSTISYFTRNGKVNKRAVADARRHLRRTRYLQTVSQGWTGSVQLPVGIGGQLNSGRSKAEYPLTYPEIVEQFRSFARRVARVVHERGDRVCIGVDELDRIGTAEQAERFLNEIKGIFGVPYVYFIVSVSDDALTSFERRGLPLRDTFDSAFDEIVRVGPLPYAESRRLLYRRVIGLTEPYIALCHCLSGGLPRDLIRAARQVIEAAKRPLPEGENVLASTAAAVVRDEIRRKAGASPNLSRLAHALDRGDYADQPVLSILYDLPEDAEDFAAYVYFCGTLEDVFTWRRPSTAELIAATSGSRDPGTFDALASARVALGHDTRLAWDAIGAFRERWGDLHTPEWGAWRPARSTRKRSGPRWTRS